MFSERGIILPVQKLVPKSENDPDALYAPASDTLGHNASTTFRMPPAMMRQLKALCDDKGFPLDSKGEICRAALLRFFNDFVGKYNVPSVMGQVRAMLEVTRETQFNRKYIELFDSLSAEVTSLIASGAMDHASYLIERVVSHIEEMPEGFWKEKYMKEIRAKFGQFMKEG